MPTSKREVLSSISFGHRVAEEEGDELTKYFVETDHWRRLVSDQVDVAYGAKGSGKSALYALILANRDLLFDRSVLIVAAENPRGAPVFRDLVTNPPASEREFIALWKLYFACLATSIFDEYGISGPAAARLRAALEREGLVRRERNLISLLRGAVDYVRRATRPKTVEAGINVDPNTGLPKGFTGKITFQEPNASGVDRGFQSVDQLLELTNDALTAHNFRLWLLLDRLDVAFSETPELEQNALRALFRVYLDLRGLRRISVKIFLRSDIWKRITESGFREGSHVVRSMTISWDRATLLNLLIRRAIANSPIRELFEVDESTVLASGESQLQLFYRMFPMRVDVGQNKPMTLDWILSRTADGTGSTAPRDLIHFLNELCKTEIRHLEIGDPEPPAQELFARAAFKEALSEVSNVRLQQTLFAEYPTLRDSLDALRGEKTSQSGASLARIWKMPKEDALKAAHELVEIGFFERRGPKDAPEFWVPFIYRDALELVQGRDHQQD